MTSPAFPATITLAVVAATTITHSIGSMIIKMSGPLLPAAKNSVNTTWTIVAVMRKGMSTFLLQLYNHFDYLFLVTIYSGGVNGNVERIKNDGEFALFELFELVGLPEPTERANSFALAEDAERIMKKITDYLYFLEPCDKIEIERMQKFSEVLQARSVVSSDDHCVGGGGGSGDGGGRDSGRKNGGDNGTFQKGPGSNFTRLGEESNGSGGSIGSSMSGQQRSQYSNNHEELGYEGDTSEQHHSDDDGCNADDSVDDSDSDDNDNGNDDCNDDGKSRTCTTEKAALIGANDQVQFLDTIVFSMVIFIFCQSIFRYGCTVLLAERLMKLVSSWMAHLVAFVLAIFPM